MDEMPNAAETIERLAREAERLQLEKEQLQAKVAELLSRVAELEAAAAKEWAKARRLQALTDGGGQLPGAGVLLLSLPPLYHTKQEESNPTNEKAFGKLQLAKGNRRKPGALQ